MPLLDHFHPPISRRLPWPSLFNGWACRIADVMNEQLPKEYVAYQFVTLLGHTEVDSWSSDQPLLVNTASFQEVPNAHHTQPLTFPECVEIRVRHLEFPEYTAVIVLVAPGNKTSHSARLGLAARCVGYLQMGVAVAVVDVVTSIKGRIHDEVLSLLGVDTKEWHALGDLYAVSYRPVERERGTGLDIWTYAIAVGSPLPTIPLRVIADTFVPVDLESTYTETCRRRKLS